MHVRLADDVVDLAVELGDDAGVGLGRREEADPGALAIVVAELLEGRDVGQRGGALRAGDRQAFQRSLPDMADHGRHRVADQIDMAADGRAHRRPAALKWNVDRIDLRQRLEEIGGTEMRAAAGAGGRVGDGLAVRVREEVAQVLRRVGGAGREHFGRGCGDGDGRELRRRIAGPLGYELGDQQRRRGHQQGVAVGCRGRNRPRPDAAGRAAAILDHHRLAEPLAQRRSDQAGNRIGSAARRERHDQIDALGRIVCRLRDRELLRPKQGERRQEGRPDRRCRHVLASSPNVRTTISFTSGDSAEAAATRRKAACASARRLGSSTRQLLSAESSRAATCGFFGSSASTVSTTKS